MKTSLMTLLLLATVGAVAQPSTFKEVVVEPITRLSLFQTYRLSPLPPSLEKVRGVHPRLYLDRERVAELRQALRTTHASVWKELRELADREVKRGPPAYRERDNSSGDEQLWQREVGNAMPVLAMAWVLSGEQRYLEAARQWALASCGYRTWGLGRIDGMDLAAGHQLFGLGLIYDWCFDDLGEEARRTIRDTLVKRTSAMFEAAATGKVWWHQSYLQNHLWVNITGMAVAGLALFDEVDDAAGWIGLPLRKFQRTMAVLGPDGASHEGVGYWEYGVEYMLKFMELARTRLDVNLYTGDWWRNTALYAQYLALPRHAWTRASSLVDMADCPRSHWYGPDYLLRGLAREFHDGHAQWLAQQVEDAGVASPQTPWLNLLWLDPALRAEPPSSLPTWRHFEDLGLVSARSDWSGDESLVAFKCGPCLGHQAVQEFSYDPGAGHVHPDANHFVLFGAGEWLVRDDGYRAKWTGQHNTLLVDGRGQLGEGQQWFQPAEALAVKAHPRIVRASSSPDLDQMTGEASEAYARDLGLRRYARHLLFLKPDVLLVCDEVVTDQPRQLELRFHPESRPAAREGNAFVMRGAKASLRLEPLATAPEVSVSGEDLAMEGREGERNQTMFTIRLSQQAAVWRNAVALSWSASGQPSKTVRVNKQGEVWEFSVDGRSVTLDWTSGSARLAAATMPALGILASGDSIRAVDPSDTRTWQRWDHALRSSRHYDNPYADATLRVTYSGPGNRTLRGYGFWDGGDTFRIRCAFPVPGAWRWETECSDAANAGLHGQHGTVDVAPYQGANPLYGHGFLKVSDNRRYLVCGDGTPFLWLGDTAWAAPQRASAEEWEAYLADRTAKHFTLIQVAPASQWAGDVDRQGQKAFTEKSCAQWNPAYWQAFEGKVQRANESGLAVMLVGLMEPVSRYPEPRLACLFARNIVARLFGNFVVFSPSFDSEFMPLANEVGRAARDATTVHLLTQHPGTPWNQPTPTFSDQYYDQPYLDIAAVQTGHNGGHLDWCAHHAIEWNLHLYRHEPHKPVINLEAMYDARGKNDWRAVDARSLGWRTWLSGAMGYTYGAGDLPPKVPQGSGALWKWVTDPEKYDYWEKALQWESAFQMQYLRDFLAALEWWRLEPAHPLIRNQPAAVTRRMVLAKSPAGDLAVAYLPDNEAIEIDMSGFPAPLRARWFDPVRNRYTPAAEAIENAGVHRFAPPAGGDWVLLLLRQ